MNESQSAIERIWRRLLFVVGRGRVAFVDDAQNVQFLQLRLGALEIRDKTPRLAEFGFTSVPPVDSDVTVLFIAGDRSNGVAIATGHQASRPKNLKPGDAMLYSVDGKSVYIPATGPIVIDTKGQGIIVKGNTTIHGNVTVQGAVTATGEGTFNGGHTVSGHIHSDPQGGNTGPASG